MTQVYGVDMATEAERRAITEPGGLAEQFFDESEFGQFTRFNPEALSQVLMSDMVDQMKVIVLVGRYKGEMVGFLVFSLDQSYTVDPLAQLFLFYVASNRRYGPLGRALMAAAEAVAAELGAVVFYAGATANIGRGVDQSLMNLLDKRGYLRLGGVSRKILREEG